MTDWHWGFCLLVLRNQTTSADNQKGHDRDLAFNAVHLLGIARADVDNYLARIEA